MIKGIRNIDEHEPLKLFIILLYILLISHNFYHVIFLEYIFNFYGIIFEIIFLILLGIGIVFDFYFRNSESVIYLKYSYAILTILYLLLYDYIPIHMFGNKYSGPYLEFFLIIFSPLFLNLKFHLTITAAVLIRFLIATYMFKISYSKEFFLTLLAVIIASYIIFVALKLLVEKLRGYYEKQLKETALSIIGIIELKDPYTKGHSIRVANYAQILAKATNRFNKADLNRFYLACLLHDIGKIGIPDTILNKETSLTEEEYNTIKKHPIYGVEVVQHLSLVEKYIAVIRSHHEKWDGTGYPDELKGSQIPFCARIVAIADAFDAMTSSRAYRSALLSKVAYGRIIEGSESQFDPQLIEVFKEIYPLWHQNIEEIKK
ncbi:hypothetical protein IAW_06049 [Bacillus cereus str. Schrouff]|uniref:HD-GYP domain-containing protein n=1 Tax=Bacillus cereus TaxID=1396 RepID=UPI00033004DD|nr:HD-GYP domain-containing protein [Bacillus cereus]EOO04735.1 hypothetical protein IAW_06049 [Bacillus cereus str. Schrouff]EOO81415.1 hypothetical protein IGY_05845 [Bacillus cereus K-5975c]